MDIITPILICLFVFFLCSMCGYCCRRKQHGAIFSTPVIVTTTTSTTAAGPYPVSVQATPGGGLQATPYPTGGPHMPMPQPQMVPTIPPYPTHGGAMPQPYGAGAGYPPNPPYPTTDPSRMNPPSYDQVVSEQKQAPYNPHYMGN